MRMPLHNNFNLIPSGQFIDYWRLPGIDEHMNNSIFDKSDKGREEIATRKYHLASRLRALLVLMDGRHTAEDLLQKVSGLGLNEKSIGELLENGFIQAAPEPQGTGLPVDAANIQASNMSSE